MDGLRVARKRDNLMQRKLEIDGKLSEAKIQLTEAKAKAWAAGTYLPPEEFSAMQRNVSFLARESQRLQFELRGDRKRIHETKDEKGHLFIQEFFMIAKKKLDRELFKEICTQAEANLNVALARLDAKP